MLYSRAHSLGTKLADLLMPGGLFSTSPWPVPEDLFHSVKSCPKTRNKCTYHSISCVMENSSPETWTRFHFISITISKRNF